MWFYRVTEFEHNDYSNHHGYYHKKENAIKAAEKAVLEANKEQHKMREHMKLEGLDFDIENYPDLVRDMDENINHDNFMVWKGGYKEVCIHMVETDD